MGRTAFRSAIGGICAMFAIAGCARIAPVPSAAAPAILAALRDSIRKGGEATRLVTAPPRSYQRPATPGAVEALGVVLGLPVSPRTSPHPSCRWAPADSMFVGMDITMTELDVVGDSARVSVLRECDQRARGRVMTFQAEPTWFLIRRNGRWVVVGGVMRVTIRRSQIREAVG